MKSLFDKTKAGAIVLKNRFVRASVGDHVKDGFVSAAMIEKYEALARGGVSTILSGYTLVDGNEHGHGITAMWSDEFIAGWKPLIDSVHSCDANIILQLVSVGSGYNSPADPSMPLLGASAVPNMRTGRIPKAMTLYDIERLKNQFAEAALRAKNAGFDGVELHAAHGYLFHQFSTPYYNRRSDAYGGSLNNRSRLTIETYQTIRKEVGPDFPVWIKLQSQDGYEGGVMPSDCIFLASRLAEEGIDAIEISGNFTDFRSSTAYFRNTANLVALNTGVPVVVTGGNRNLNEMRQMINETAIDYIGKARPLISQPDLINRLAAVGTGKSRCVSCNKCLSPEFQGSCILNK